MSLKERLRCTWHWQVVRTFKCLAQCRLKRLLSRHAPAEGDSMELDVEHFSGRLTELLRCRTVYAQRIRQVQNTPWKRVPAPGTPLRSTRYEGAAEQVSSA